MAYVEMSYGTLIENAEQFKEQASEGSLYIDKDGQILFSTYVSGRLLKHSSCSIICLVELCTGTLWLPEEITAWPLRRLEKFEKISISNVDN